MLKKFNNSIQYSFLGNSNICTVFTKPLHAMKDILDCKEYVRKQNQNVLFRKVVHIRG